MMSAAKKPRYLSPKKCDLRIQIDHLTNEIVLAEGILASLRDSLNILNKVINPAGEWLTGLNSIVEQIHRQNSLVADYQKQLIELRSKVQQSGLTSPSSSSSASSAKNYRAYSYVGIDGFDVRFNLFKAVMRPLNESALSGIDCEAVQDLFILPYSLHVNEIFIANPVSGDSCTSQKLLSLEDVNTLEVDGVSLERLRIFLDTALKSPIDIGQAPSTEFFYDNDKWKQCCGFLFSRMGACGEEKLKGELQLERLVPSILYSLFFMRENKNIQCGGNTQPNIVKITDNSATFKPDFYMTTKISSATVMPFVCEVKLEKSGLGQSLYYSIQALLSMLVLGVTKPLVIFSIVNGLTLIYYVLYFIPDTKKFFCQALSKTLMLENEMDRLLMIKASYGLVDFMHSFESETLNFTPEIPRLYGDEWDNWGYKSDDQERLAMTSDDENRFHVGDNDVQSP
ncbi:unnamed protein product [Didymodactylos carnosus]|uniref:Uncharacterized protein n=1 Tax=Didymodactylos carnosus TaxID=1234261 RepID=A0A815S2U5_9BILA|nr:unnamed protein product [Didymodactylos carnosus]CAF4350300.1 unnamed protein product [Didymodactylos carnosus]